MQGKPLAEARGEVTHGAEFLRWFSEEAVREFGRYSVSPDGKSRLLVTTKPVGPCLLITPWNFPLAMAIRKIAPAVAAGCTMVLKPAKLTPLTSMLLVAPIITFSSEDEAVRLANNTEYGLVAYVFTKDLNRGIRMGERLDTGMLGLNAGVVSNAAAPFGGVKQSGLGREGGLEGIDEYLYTQYIGINDPYTG